MRRSRGALAPGAKFKIIESSAFRTSSNNVGLYTKSDVTTKDGQKLKQSFYSFEIREGTYLCVSCTGPGDGSFDQTNRLHHEDVSACSLNKDI
jgi:hypothetical protein